MLTPRKYQVELVDRARQALIRSRRVLAVLPTGGGKTQIGQMIVHGAFEKGRSVLWLAHRRELITQAADRINDGSRDRVAGILMAGRRQDLRLPVQVASIDTIADWQHLPPADLVVVDEAHHAVAATHRSILGYYPGAWVLGLTATPSRGDGTALGDVFREMVHGPTVRQLIAGGYLVEPDVIGPTSQDNTLARDPVEAWRRLAGGRPGFLFARTVKASKEYVQRLVAAGMRAAHVDGTTTKSARNAAVDGFRDGTIDILSSVGVFTEGVDVPRAEVCMLARSCEHPGTYLQMVGRVLRPYPGKRRALVIDLVGAAHSHGLPDDDREWSLDGEPIRNMDREAPMFECEECGAIWRAARGRTCSLCGWEKPEPKMPEIVERPMEDLRAILGPKQEKLAELRQIAAARGLPPKWVGMKFRSIFGHWPAAVNA